MIHDGLFTKKIVGSLQSLTTGRIYKINQPDNNMILMVVRRNRQNHQLLLSVHPGFSRLQLTTKKCDNPLSPPTFTRIFRKHSEGSVAEPIKQIGNDRRIEVDIEGKDEIGGTIYRTIIPEIVDKHSNLILVNENREIIEGFKHLTPNANHYRTVVPGSGYGAPPTQYEINSYDITGAEVLKYIDFNAGNIVKQLLNQLEGFGPLITSKIISRRQFTTSPTLPETFNEVMVKTKLPPTPIFHKDHETGEEDFYFIKLNQFNGDTVTCDSPNDLLDRFYNARGERERVKQRASDLV